MSRALTILASLLLILSVGGGSFAHAIEPVGCIDTQTSELTGHAEGDSDEVPADSDKGYPHHHAGCQGHQIAAPTDLAITPTHAIVTTSLGLAQTVALHGASTDPALRPPQA